MLTKGNWFAQSITTYDLYDLCQHMLACERPTLCEDEVKVTAKTKHLTNTYTTISDLATYGSSKVQHGSYVRFVAQEITQACELHVQSRIPGPHNPLAGSNYAQLIAGLVLTAYSVNCIPFSLLLLGNIIRKHKNNTKPSSITCTYWSKHGNSTQYVSPEAKRVNFYRNQITAHFTLFEFSQPEEK